MGDLVKKIDIAALITSFYVTLVWLAYICVEVADSKRLIRIFAVSIFVCTYLCTAFISKKIRKIDIPERRPIGKKEKKAVFILASISIFLIMLIWFMAYFPGSFSNDSITQYSQAVDGQYNDWHPVWHTLIFFTIPLKIFGNSSAIVLLQIIYFSFTMGYLALAICEMWNIQVSIIALAYIALNPYTGQIILYPWKDVAFALGGVLCAIIAVRMVVNKERVPKLWSFILFGVVWASTTIFRHNAVLFTAPLLFALCLNMKKENWIKMVIFSLVSLFIIKVPIYGALDVGKPGKRVIETMGWPLTVIANVVKKTPELMDEEMSEFVYAMASQEEWEEHYTCGNFNLIKRKIDTSVVEETGHWGVIKLMLKSFKYSPMASLKATIELTDMVYGFENGLEGDVAEGIVDNPLGIQYPETVNENLRELVSAYSSFINDTVFRYLRTYGMALLAMLLVALSRLNFRSWNSWKKVFMIIPIFTYDFGTMLLLTGDDSRFFFITFLITPLMIVYAFCNGKEKDHA